MECCFGQRKKNKPPTKDYEPYEPTSISRVRTVEPNDVTSINENIEAKQKLNRLSKLNLKMEEEKIPFPPRTVKVQIEM